MSSDNGAAGSAVSNLEPLFARRYQLLRELGGGGMAFVYEALDITSDRRVALKRPQRREAHEARQRVHELFAFEFYTLSQLAHPRIVAVYDYGIEEGEPYYTMELLDGGDLHGLVRTDYLRICAIARDVCSALSLLHSRRLVHRDVSPRNIRIAADQTGKLIDFGALAMMGPTKELIGTPAYTPPELVNLQPIDGRADLYALGATLYYALTGRHAYPVRDFASLAGAWHMRLPRPSELMPGIPPALDALVLDLLQLDLQARPSNAAEVMERLSAIEGRAVGEQHVVAQSYLSTPAHVGRESELARVRTKLQRVQRKHGRAILITGGPGVGRSRFLDASVLAGKLTGVTVLRADADDAVKGEYGVMRALLVQLLRALPDVVRPLAAPELNVLAYAAPELAEGVPVELKAFDDPSALRPQLQAALRQLIVAAADAQPLLIAVDDLHRIDEPSAAAIALLARGIQRSAIMIVATAETGAQPSAPSAHRLFSDTAGHVILQPLTQAEARSLLGSIFGESSASELLFQRLHAIAQGSPRDLLRLAQHLVDRGLARYHGGSWSLPSEIDTSDLPSSVAQMLAARRSALSESARRLVSTLALCPEQSFGFEECCALAAPETPAGVVADLEQLIKADMLRKAGERVALADRAWLPVLLSDLPEPQARAAHERLAFVFGQREQEEFRVAQHLLRAGQRDRALDVFVAHAVRSQEQTDKSPEEFFKFIRSLPDDWLQTYEDALKLSRQFDRPRRDTYALRSRLAGLVALIGRRDTTHIPELIAELRACAGLDDWAAADAQLEAMPRLVWALERTQARYDAASEHERVVEPIVALRALARATITSVGASTPLLDVPALRALPSLEPLAVLSPALAVVQNLVQGVHARLTGRSDLARTIYRGLLERTAAPDRAGLDPTHHRYMRVLLMNGLAMVEASMGLDSSLEWARQIETDPLFQVNAVLVRMLYQFWQGNSLEAERYKRELDVLRIESSSRQAFENTHLVWQVIAQAAMEDLTRLKRTLDEIRIAAEDFPGWRPVLAFARAEYQRVRGDAQNAIAEVTMALREVAAGDHQMWANLAGTHVRALDDAGRTEDALRWGETYVAQATAAGLSFGANSILLPLSVAQARAGHPDAVANAERVLARLRELGSTGLNLGLAYEARARIAQLTSDRAAYDVYATRCSEVYARAGNPALSTRYQKLKRDAQRNHVVTVPPPVETVRERERGDLTQLQLRLRDCRGSEERARLALALLGEHSGVSEGFLYWMRDGVLQLAASLGPRSAPPEGLFEILREYVAAETQADENTTGEQTEQTVLPEWSAMDELSCRPVLLSHYDDDAYVVCGIAALLVGAGQSFVYPSEVAAQISRIAMDKGDVTAIIVPE